MTGLEVSRRAAGIKPGDAAVADKLAAEILGEAREIPAALVGKVIGTPRKDAVNCTYVTVALEDHAMEALLGRVEGCTAARRRQFLDWIVDHERRQRGRILACLETLFDNGVPVTGATALKSVGMAPPAPHRAEGGTNGHARTATPAGEPSSGTGEAGTPRRICDDAFLLARRLMTAPGEACDLKADEKFLRLPADQRDRGIQRLLKSPRWAAMVVRG